MMADLRAEGRADAVVLIYARRRLTRYELLDIAAAADVSVIDLRDAVDRLQARADTGERLAPIIPIRLPRPAWYRERVADGGARCTCGWEGLSWKSHQAALKRHGQDRTRCAPASVEQVAA